MASVQCKKSKATDQWENLPPDILSILAKLLNSEIDILRLRSVCSSWRSSLLPPYKPIPFPLKLSPVYTRPRIKFNGEIILDEITLYRLSPPTDEAGSSNGWLLRAVTRTNSKACTLLNPVTIQKMEGRIPKHLNLLDCKISEICKYHEAKFTFDRMKIKKVIALPNFFRDCDFAALTLNSNGRMHYWKIGDKFWTPIDTKHHHFIYDVILFQGKCYAVDDCGDLVCLDSDLNLTVVADNVGLDNEIDLINTFLVECHSDLYVMHYYRRGAAEQNQQIDDESYHPPSCLATRKFNECNCSWDSFKDLKDAFFILSDYASHSFNARDFAGFKGNRVYVNNERFDLQFSDGDMLGDYDFEDLGEEILPPSWLHV